MMKQSFTWILAGCPVIWGMLFFSCTENDNLLVPSGERAGQSGQTQLTTEEVKALNVSMQGAYISEDQALQKASAFFGKAATKAGSLEKSRHTYWVRYTSALPQLFSFSSKPDSIPLYLVGYEDGRSILVSGDERLPDVLAYSDNGTISLEKNGSGLDVIIDNLPVFVSHKIDEFELRYDSLLQVTQNKSGLSAASAPLQRIESNLSEWKTIYEYAPMVPVQWGTRWGL